MRQMILGGLASLALTLAAARPAAAQVEGLPVYNGGIPTGIVIAADAGIPNGDAGKGLALGLTGRAGLGPLGVTATLATHNPKGAGDNITSVGATLNYKVFGGPLVPFSITLQGGAGYWKLGSGSALPGYSSDFKVWRFPVGLGIAVSIPNPAFSIRPWVAPRLDIRHVSVTGASDTQTDFALSGGIELNTISGFGLQAAYDRVFGDGANPSVLSAGLHYALRLPGL